MFVMCDQSEPCRMYSSTSGPNIFYELAGSSRCELNRVTPSQYSTYARLPPQIQLGSMILTKYHILRRLLTEHTIFPVHHNGYRCKLKLL
jgi:hypothetical protein